MHIEDARESHRALDRLNALNNVAEHGFVRGPAVIEPWSIYKNVEFATNCGMAEVIFLSNLEETC